MITPNLSGVPIGILAALEKDRQAKARADAIRMAAMQNVPKPRNMTLLEGLIGILGSAVDPRGGAGQQFLQGVGGGIQNDFANRQQQFDLANRRAMIEAGGAERDGEYGLKAAEVVEGSRQAREAMAARQAEALAQRQQQIEMEKMRQTGRLSLQQWRDLSEIAPESRAAYASRILGIEDPAMLDGLSKMTPAEIARMASAGLTDERTRKTKWEIDVEGPNKIADRKSAMAYRDGPQTRILDAKTQTENATRDSKVQKLLTGLKVDEANAELIGKKVSHFDAEFQSRLAERSARAWNLRRNMSEGKAGDPFKAVSQERILIEGQNSIYQKQTDAILKRNGGNPPSQLSADFMPYTVAQQGLKENAERMSELQSVIAGAKTQATAAGGKRLGQTVRTGEESLFARAEAAIAKGAPRSAVIAVLEKELQRMRGK